MVLPPPLPLPSLLPVLTPIWQPVEDEDLSLGCFQAGCLSYGSIFTHKSAWANVDVVETRRI